MAVGLESMFNPQTPKVFRQPKTPKGDTIPLDFCLGMISGSRIPTVIMKKFYLHCMNLKIKVKHFFA